MAEIEPGSSSQKHYLGSVIEVCADDETARLSQMTLFTRLTVVRQHVKVYIFPIRTHPVRGIDSRCLFALRIYEASRVGPKRRPTHSFLLPAMRKLIQFKLETESFLYFVTTYVLCNATWICLDKKNTPTYLQFPKSMHNISTCFLCFTKYSIF